MSQTKKMTIGAMLIAISVLLPMFCHYLPIAQAGTVLLPMHLPTFIGGMILGPTYGMILGVLSPIVSCLVTGMPSSSFVLFMVAELAMYGLVSGLMYQYLNLYTHKYGMYISLISAMLLGRLAYALMLFTASLILQVELGGFTSVMASLLMGMPGIVIQLILVPLVVKSLENAHIVFYNKQLKMND